MGLHEIQPEGMHAFWRLGLTSIVMVSTLLDRERSVQHRLGVARGIFIEPKKASTKKRDHDVKRKKWHACSFNCLRLFLVVVCICRSWHASTIENRGNMESKNENLLF